MNKKSLVVMMLVCVLGFGMVMGCGDDDSGDNTGSNNNNQVAKVVEAKYRGTWVDDSDVIYTFELTENEYIRKNSGIEQFRIKVWTVGTILYKEPVDLPIKVGTFTSDTTYSTDGPTYFTKQ